jgi:phage terminase large subunit-like protein
VMVSVALPLWVWLKNPSYKWAFHSHSPKLMQELQKKRLKVLRSQLFQRYWGDSISVPARVSTENVTNDQGGELLLMGPAVTGMGADSLIIDDPTSGKQARFENQLQAQEEIVKEVIFSRLNERSGGILVIQQRQDPEDLSGTLKGELGWRFTVIPPVFDEDTTIEVFDGTQLKIDKGTLVDAVRFSQENLDEMKRAMGARACQAEILQKPVAGETIIEGKWIKPYDYQAGMWRSIMDTVIVSVDTASVSAEGHSRWGINVFGIKSFLRTRFVGGVPASEYVNGVFHLDTATRHLEYTEAREVIVRLVSKHKADGVWSEQATHGIPLSQELQRLGITGVRLINVNLDGKKANRLWASTTAIEDGRFYVPLTNWGDSYKKDLLKCKKRLPETDPAWDNADSTSMFLNELARNPGLNAIAQLRGWSQLSSVTGKQAETEKPWKLGWDPFCPPDYVHTFDFERASGIIGEHDEENLIGMISSDGDLYDVTQDEVEKRLKEGWEFEFHGNGSGNGRKQLTGD